MNPLQLQRLLMSSFSSSSIVNTTGALLLKYSLTLCLYRTKQVLSTEKMNRRSWALSG